MLESSFVVRLFVLLGAAGAPALGQVYADSVQDFSSLQGFRGWRYGFYDGVSSSPYAPADFKLMPNYNFAGLYWSRQEGVGGYWTTLGRELAVPNGMNGNSGRARQVNWAVRRWVSTRSGPAILEGRLYDDLFGGQSNNGAVGRLTHNGELIWSAHIDGFDEVGHSFTIQRCLEVGDILDLSLDPHEGDDAADHFFHTLRISGPIARQPASITACRGGNVAMQVDVVGSGYTIQWRKGGEPIPGQTTSRLRFPFVRPADAGVYDALISADCGSVASAPATLTVCLADFNCDGRVDFFDYLDFVRLFADENIFADFNEDGQVDFFDYLDFMREFIEGC